MRGVSLDEIAAATKIGTRSLKALEDENFAILPGGIFNKGFVRAYARFLGMNEDEAVADYNAAVQEQPVSVKTIAAQNAVAKANRLAAEQARESSNVRGIVRAVGLLVVVSAIAFGAYKAFRLGYFHALRHPSLHRQLKEQAAAPPQTQPTPAPVTAPPSQAATPSPAPPAPQSSASQQPLPPGSTPSAGADEFTVSVKTSAPSWLSVVADGHRATQRLFEANEQQAFTAKSKVRILIGNPAGTELSLNGRPLQMEGNLTHPRTVVVGANGFATQ